MSLINVSNLTFAYEGSYDNIFEDVSFQIDTDWKLGFCGRNGRGKTTFLKLLMGEYEYSGNISAGVTFEYFPYVVSDLTQNTEEIFDIIAPEAEPWQIFRELSKLSVNEDVLYRPFSTLSNGEQTKVLLAGLFLRENSFLLIDEPTNHLDMAARKAVSEYLNSKSGFILVSHDRTFLDGCVDHILSINRANIEIQSGNFSSWYHNKQMQDNYELAENERLRKDIKRLEKAARQSSQWADKVESAKMGKGAAKDRKKGLAGMGSKEYKAEQSKRMQQRRKNLERRQHSAIDEKSGLLKNIDSADSLKLSHEPYYANRLATLENISIFYGDKEACHDVSFTIDKSDRIALRGKNGSGKSSIIKLICANGLCGTNVNSEASIDIDADTNFTYTGNLQVGSRLKISYVSQDTSFLQGDLSDFAELHGIDESLFKAILRKLDFSRVQFEKDMQDFSGGQKKKVLIAKSLCEKSHLLIWDEPLNFIDVISRIQIETLLSEYTPTILFVEHDKAFCDAVASKIIELE